MSHDCQIGYDTPSSILRRRYDWGLMVTVMVGMAYSVPLHPDHQTLIARVADTGRDEVFQDETGTRWNVSVEDDEILLREIGNEMAVAIPLDELVEA